MVKIRPIEAADEASWRKLWAGYLEFYKALDFPEQVTAKTFQRLIGEYRMFAFVAEQDGILIGFVHCILHPATWAASDYCYLEDLFVATEARRTGAGRALIKVVYAEAEKRGCAQVYWLTQEGNSTARNLYDKLASLTGFVHYRREL